jgi:hypothetical protein
VKRTALFCIASQLFLPPVLPQATASALPKDEAPLQRFVCNTGYTPEKCHKDMAVLRRALAKYPTAQLGNWTWILVRSEDWKPILMPRALDPDSPTFTYYAKKETFVEEALVADVPGRRDELKARWNMSLERLRDLAIAHELGHALCNDKSEEIANQGAERLLEGKSPSCEANTSLWWRRGESEYSGALKTRKLLKNRNAANAKTSKIGPNWNVTGMRLFGSSTRIPPAISRQ